MTINLENMDYKELLELQKQIQKAKVPKKEEYKLSQNADEIEKRLNSIGTQIEKLVNLGAEKDQVIQAIEEWIIAHFG